MKKTLLFCGLMGMLTYGFASEGYASDNHDDGEDKSESTNTSTNTKAHQNTEHSSEGHSNTEHKKAGSHSAPHWGYSGVDGPAHWGSLADEFALCGSGREQSPINIKDELEMNLIELEFHYGDSRRSKIINNGHTIQVNYAPGSYALIGGKKHELLQFHFHAPSEHKIHGKHADMVVHLVHKSEEGSLAVVAVLFDRGEKNRFITPIWKAMPKHKGESTVSGALSIERLLPSNKRYYNYRGSLTTPPCSEGVNWNILTTRMSVSSAQVKAFKKIFPKSVRPVQPVNQRVIGVR